MDREVREGEVCTIESENCTNNYGELAWRGELSFFAPKSPFWPYPHGSWRGKLLCNVLCVGCGEQGRGALREVVAFGYGLVVVRPDKNRAGQRQRRYG
jgi:hypothetical protein